MNTNVYLVVNRAESGAVFRRLPLEFAKISGRDRVSFLQGQISNDTVKPITGEDLNACLLNSTGHLLAYLALHFFEDSILLGTDKERLPIVVRTLERYLVREKVAIESSSSVLYALQGNRAKAIAEGVINEFDTVIATSVELYNSADGVNLLVDEREADQLQLQLLRAGALNIDDDTAHVLRVEHGEPRWGAELDESIIPLEAGLDKAISYTKGCYVGQEIIARIHSRGHTNRSLVGLRLGSESSSGDTLQAASGEKLGAEVGRITSFANSPKFGKIGLGYVRNEFVAAGTVLSSNGGQVTVAELPFAEGG